MKSPLLWFVIVGVILFAAESYFSKQAKRIIVDSAVREQLDQQWQTQTGSTASPEELASLTDHWVREELMYREALQLGLDRDDSIVRRRLIQKLRFLVEDVEDVSVQSDELERFYQNKITKYTLPVRYSFSQIYFSSEAKLNEALVLLSGGKDWRLLGASSLLSDSYVSRSQKQIVSTMGRNFAGQMERLVQDVWVGPVKSSYGLHLVRLEQKFPEQITPLEYIQKKVMEDYRQSQAGIAMDIYAESLLEKYELVIE